MKRIVKKPDERRAEMVAAARKLFLREGFTDVPVSRIVREVGVAQGTFYYYFSSKEEVLDAVIDDYVAGLASGFDAVARDTSRNPRATLEAMVRLELSYDAKRARELASIKGGDVHTRLFSRTTTRLSPRYQAVIEKGIENGAFTTPCPDLVAETILLHIHFLFDRDVFGWSRAEYERRAVAAARLIEVLLELAPNSLDFSFGKD